MDWMDYRKKLGIGFSDEQKFDYFVMNLRNFFATVNESISFSDYFSFCNMVGVICHVEYSQDYHATKRFNLIHNVIFSKLDAIEDFLAYFCAFLNTYRNPIPYASKHTREDYKNLLLNMLDQAHISFDIFEDDDGYFVFPKGAKELDDALISQPLEWLSNYPNARKTYINALHQYADGIYIRDVADNLRKALETFLQEFLGNNKNLESNKNEICKYLGQQGVDAGISGLFLPVINSYKNVNDRIAKHNDRVDEKLLEFLLYQTGVLIRMVLSVKGMEAEGDAD